MIQTMVKNMLDCEILKTNYGVSYGSTTLKSLQNDSIPELDLLVREAVQNSSDAALTEKGDSYSVNFTTGKFCPQQFNAFMTKAEGTLNSRFSGDKADFLEIRDTNTSGLTGYIRKTDINKNDHGNFFKLIYDTGKKQTTVSAGGNWGFGKSVYYRVGNGIVIFYSRIKNDNRFEERLIITLIEDETKGNSDGKDSPILNSIEELSAGKAWWGIRDEEDLLPLTQETCIRPILDVFNIKPFKENETGTSIIIPYIETEKLLNEIVPVNSDMRGDEKEYFINVFASDIAKYLKLAVQRWYAPKIHNREIKNLGLDSKWLYVSVNNEPISKDKLFPFFYLVQELYTAALAAANDTEYKSDKFKGIETMDVNINSYFSDGRKAGCVSVLQISKAEITNLQTDLNPYDYIGKFEVNGGVNEPIVMYVRDPGMVIDYAIDGPWIKNLTPSENPDEYIFAFFVPATKKAIKDDFELKEYAGMPLGEYLRKCEASDHMAWTDPVKMQLVQRIQKNTVNLINGKTKSNSSTGIDATASKLSSRLGKSLLPRIGYGKKSKSPSDPLPVGMKSKDYQFTADAVTVTGDCVTMNFTLKLMHEKKEGILSLMIVSEGGRIDAKSWKEEIGTRFPAQIVECDIEKILTSVSKDTYSIEEKCNVEHPEVETDEISINLISETDDSVNTQLRIMPKIQNPELNGIIKLRTYDKKYRFSFRIE